MVKRKDVSRPSWPVRSQHTCRRKDE